MKIKIVLVEMDPVLQEKLESLLMLYNCFEITARFDDINEANEYLCCHDVDAVFVNAKTGNAAYSGDGTFLVANLAQMKPDMIVVLYADEERPAGQVFGYPCDEFFVLPFNSQVLQRVVGRVQYLYRLLQYKKQSVNRSIMIKTRKGYQLVEIQQILFIERVNRKNRLVMVDGKEVILSGYSLDELEKILEEHNFYRCYQSFIVNLSKVSYIKADNEKKYFSVIFDGYAGEVMLSRDKYAEVVQLLKEKYAKIVL